MRHVSCCEHAAPHENDWNHIVVLDFCLVFPLLVFFGFFCCYKRRKRNLRARGWRFSYFRGLLSEFEVIEQKGASACDFL